MSKAPPRDDFERFLATRGVDKRLSISCMVQLPTGATQEQTLEVMKKLEHHYLVDEKAVVDSMFSVLGFSFAGSGQNMPPRGSRTA